MDTVTLPKIGDTAVFRFLLDGTGLHHGTILRVIPGPDGVMFYRVDHPDQACAVVSDSRAVSYTMAPA